MRILAGRHKGQRLDAVAGGRVRPTGARMRQRIFDLLTQSGAGGMDLNGAVILDLFAGSGALGFESLSRGGARAVFIDRDAAACRALRQNAERLGVASSTLILRRDVLRLKTPPPDAPFDCVFLDPPYDSRLIAAALDRLKRPGWLKNETRIVVEAPEDSTIETHGCLLLRRGRNRRSQCLILKPRPP